MTKYSFLFAALVLFAFGCKKATDTTAPTHISFSFDRTQAPYTTLDTNNRELYLHKIMVARTYTGEIIAVSQTCTYDQTTVTLDSAGKSIICPKDKSKFDFAGAVVSGPATIDLKQYTTQIGYNLITVHD